VKLRVGIVGLGWGTVVHLPAYRAAAGFEVTGLCARTRSKLDREAARHGIAHTSTDWTEFVRRDEFDVISIATPVGLHRPITLAALEAGKHVMCEKPLALSTTEAAEMVAAADRSGTCAATCFELRWLPDRARIRRLVDDGLIGSPYFIRLAQSASYWHPSHQLQALWMYDLSEGGGYLNGLVAHDIDFVCSLFGRPEAVCADVRTSDPTRTLADGSTLAVTADDTSALLLRLEGGALAMISASVVGVHAHGAHLEVFGSRGSIVGSLGARDGAGGLRAGTVDDDGLVDVEPDRRRPTNDSSIPTRGASQLIRAMALMLEDWLPALSGRAAFQPIPSLSDGLLVQHVIEAARTSSAGAGWVGLRTPSAEDGRDE
jgi:predicted dehydrogenase